MAVIPTAFDGRCGFEKYRLIVILHFQWAGCMNIVLLIFIIKFGMNIFRLADQPY